MNATVAKESRNSTAGSVHWSNCCVRRCCNSAVMFLCRQVNGVGLLFFLYGCEAGYARSARASRQTGCLSGNYLVSVSHGKAWVGLEGAGGKPASRSGGLRCVCDRPCILKRNRCSCGIPKPLGGSGAGRTVCCARVAVAPARYHGVIPPSDPKGNIENIQWVTGNSGVPVRGS